MPGRILKAFAHLTTFGLRRAKEGAGNLRRRIPPMYDSEKLRAIREKIHTARKKKEEEAVARGEDPYEVYKRPA